MIDLDTLIRDPGFEGLWIGPHKAQGGVFVSYMNRDRRRDLQVRRDTLAECLSEIGPRKPVEDLNLDDL